MWNRALCLAVCLGSPLACDGGEPSISKSLADADAKEAKRLADAEAAKKAVVVKKDPNALELPWSVDAMKAQLQMGLKLEYAITGVDAKGKPVEDSFLGVVKAANPGDVGVVAYRASQAQEPIASQVATTPWGSLSPFFAVEKAKSKLVRTESVTVPAGSFDCVVVELEGFFGAHRTVWMVRDKPGVYAQVVDHGNRTDEADQTELTYALTSIGEATAK